MPSRRSSTSARTCACSRCRDYPSIVRDISLLVPVTIPADALRRTIRERPRQPTLERVYEFARYEGKGVPDGQVSLSFRLRLPGPGPHADRCRGAAGGRRDRRGLGAAHGARLR